MIKAGIIGSTGYAGQELVRILLGHKEAEIKWYGSRTYAGKAYADVFQNMFTLVPDICKGEDLEKLCKVYYGIHETVCYTAEGLDIEGNSVEEIMKEAEEKAVQKYRVFTSRSKL